MTELPDDAEDNEALEALKAMAYDGEPDEIATNFKNQGNDAYKAKDYRSAVEFYTKGIDAKCGIKEIDSKLYLNRAQVNLVLKNYRRCINDCKKALENDPTLIKAYFRMAKAFLSLGKYQDLCEAAQFGLKVAHDKELEDVFKTAEKRLKELQARQKREEDEQKTFMEAMKVRNMCLVFTKDYEENKFRKIALEDKLDIESQFIMDVILEFPSIDYNCVIDKTGELTPVSELLEIPQAQGTLQGLNLAKCSVFMESVGGGLVKVGKKKTLNELISVPLPVINWVVRLYVLPKEEIDSFVATWDKKERLAMRGSAEDFEY